MKICSFICGMLFCLLPLLSFGQNNKIIKVSAVRVSAEFAAPYQGKHQGPNFEVDAKGVVRPHKGYVMTIDLNKRMFRISPEGHEAAQIEKGFDVEPIPGGMMWCFCDSANDDCEIQLNMGPNRLYYFCQGGCGCIKLVESDDDEIMEYESPGGEWFGF